MWAVNLPVAKSHWDGHLTPVFLLYAVAAMSPQWGSLSWCKQQQDGAKQHFGGKMMQSCWWTQLTRLCQAALSTLKQFKKGLGLIGP